MNQLTRLPEAYEVKDSYSRCDSYWTRSDDAIRRANAIDGPGPSRRVPIKNVFVGDDGRHYLVIATEVFVDIPQQSEVLAKLTPAERKSLGF